MNQTTTADLDVLTRLAATIEARRGASTEESYSAALLANPAFAARKLGEEAIEVVIAALGSNRDALCGEAADLIYHLMALLAAKGLTLGDVAAVLAAREGISGIAEKASRS